MPAWVDLSEHQVSLNVQNSPDGKRLILRPLTAQSSIPPDITKLGFERRGDGYERRDLQFSLPQLRKFFPRAIAREFAMSEIFLRSPEEAVERYQWQRNRAGGQTFGNRQEIRPLTEALFNQYVKPGVRPEYAETFEAYRVKQPDATHCSLVQVAGAGDWRFDGVGSLEDCRPHPENPSWVKQVDDFFAEEATAFGSSADDQVRPQYRDGRTIPIDGEEVVDVRGGFGGSPVHLHGKVLSRRGALRVQITATAGVFGEAASAATEPLSDGWTIKGEEHPYDRQLRQARERNEQGQKDNEASNAELRARADASKVEGYTHLDMIDPPAGTRIEDMATGRTGTIIEYVELNDVQEPTVLFDDQPAGSAGIPIGSKENRYRYRVIAPAPVEEIAETTPATPAPTIDHTPRAPWHVTKNVFMQESSCRVGDDGRTEVVFDGIAFHPVLGEGWTPIKAKEEVHARLVKDALYGRSAEPFPPSPPVFAAMLDYPSQIYQLNQRAEKNVSRLLAQLGVAEKLLAGDTGYLKIKNPPYIDLVIERLPGAAGDRLYFTHYLRNEWSGDSFLDAEMVFDIRQNGTLRLAETATQNPIRGGESRGRDVSFANMFSKNLLDQKFGAQKVLWPREERDLEADTKTSDADQPSAAAHQAAVMIELRKLGWKEALGAMAREIGGGYQGVANPQGIRRLFARIQENDLVATFGDAILARVRYSENVTPDQLAADLDAAVIRLDIEATAVQAVEYPNKKDAMRAGEASGRNYTIRPAGDADPAQPWILDLDADKPLVTPTSIEQYVVEQINRAIARLDPSPEARKVVAEVESTDYSIKTILVGHPEFNNPQFPAAAALVDNGRIRERIIGTREIRTFAEDAAAAAAAAIDPTAPDGYALVMADEALQLQFQDTLDAFFAERIVAVRNALRAIGWRDGEPQGILTRSATDITASAMIDTKNVGHGRNVVGITGKVYTLQGGEIRYFPDDLTKTPEQIAAQMDDAALLIELAPAVTQPQPGLADADDTVVWNGKTVPREELLQFRHSVVAMIADAAQGVETTIKAQETPQQKYDAAMDEFRKASSAFRKVQEAYRAKEIGDEEFLAGKAKYDQATKATDEAETLLKRNNVAQRQQEKLAERQDILRRIDAVLGEGMPELPPTPVKVKVYGEAGAAIAAARKEVIAIALRNHFSPKGAGEYADEAARDELSASQREYGTPELVAAADRLRDAHRATANLARSFADALNAEIAAEEQPADMDPALRTLPIPDTQVLIARDGNLEIRCADRKVGHVITISRLATGQYQAKNGSAESIRGPLLQSVRWGANRIAELLRDDRQAQERARLARREMDDQRREIKVYADGFRHFLPTGQAIDPQGLMEAIRPFTSEETELPVVHTARFLGGNAPRGFSLPEGATLELAGDDALRISAAGYTCEIQASEPAPEFSEDRPWLQRNYERDAPMSFVNALSSAVVWLRGNVAWEAKKASYPDGGQQLDALARQYATLLHEAAPTYHDGGVREMHRTFAVAIMDKEVDYLLSWIARSRGQNDLSKKFFTKATGCKLPATIRDITAAIYGWAGFTPEQAATREAEKATAREARLQVKQIDDDIRWSGASLSNMRVNHEGAIKTAKEFIDEIIAQGYTDIRSYKAGAVDRYVLANPDLNRSYGIKGKMVSYAKAIFAKRELEKLQHLEHEVPEEEPQQALRP